MPNVVRFALPTAQDLVVQGAGAFVDGILDVDANNLPAVRRTRFLVQPFGAVEVGIVDAATPPPTLPAVPADPLPDPYPQYLAPDELLDGDGKVQESKLPSRLSAVELGAASVAAVKDSGSFSGAGVNVKDYGAKGDGTTNDTAAINAAITANPGRAIYFPPGVYMVNARTSTGAMSQPVGIKLNQPGVRLVLDAAATIKAITNNGTNYSIIQVTAADCAIVGGTIQGDVTTHTGSTGEWGHGIDINAGAHRCLVRDTIVRECWGDGIGIFGKPVDVCLDNVTSDSNRRQGLSIVDATRPRVQGGAYINTGALGYIGPGAGICIEPDPGTTMDVIDALIVGVMLSGNQGPGIMVSSNDRTASVSAIGARAVGNGARGGPVGPGYYVIGANCEVVFNGCHAAGNQLDGWLLMASSDRTRLLDCTSRTNSRYGVNTFAPRTVITGGAYSLNQKAGIYAGDVAAVDLSITGAIVSGNNQDGVSAPQVDLLAPGARLTGVISDAGQNTNKPAYGYAVRTTATDAVLVGCVARGAFGTAPFIDQTSAAYIAPKPGATKPTVVGSPTADVTALKNAVDSIRVNLINQGLLG